MSVAKIQAIRGMQDILPSQTPLWQYIESTVASVVERYGYGEIRMPIVESTELFSRSIGEVTDIVEKEMYTFNDRNNDSLTLRPEGTAGCVRACEEHGLLYNQQQRLWYKGPMFRYERPQKGRLRQFHQIGVEAFGMSGPDIDAELILLTASLWRALGINDSLTLELNSLGTSEARQKYKVALVAYLQEHKDALDEDSLRRLTTNPLRILDSKNQQTQQLLKEAPVLINYLDEESAAHFTQLQELLSAAGVDYEINHKLVRGLDYYGKTVFEWTTNHLGAQGTVCAGGRYDGLVEQLGGKPNVAVGFAMGIERLVLLLETLAVVPNTLEPAVDIYIVGSGAQAVQSTLLLGESIRYQLPHLKVQVNCGGGSFKSQMKKADRSNAKIALILGDDEIKQQQVTVKDLRNRAEQTTVARTDILNELAVFFKE